jgi:hypothetical protein
MNSYQPANSLLSFAIERWSDRWAFERDTPKLHFAAQVG